MLLAIHLLILQLQGLFSEYFNQIERERAIVNNCKGRVVKDYEDYLQSYSYSPQKDTDEQGRQQDEFNRLQDELVRLQDELDRLQDKHVG